MDLDLPRCDTHDRDELSEDGSFCNECAADGWSGELSFGHWLDPLNDGIAWVVVGGESGPKARPMHPDWARSLRDQCAAAHVPFIFKQWGEWAQGTTLDGNFVHAMAEGPQFRSRASGRDTHDYGDGYAAVRIGKHAAGRLLDGQLHDGYPEVKNA